MSLTKIKTQLKNRLARLRPKPVSRRALRMAEPLLFTAALLTAAVGWQFAVARPAASHTAPQKSIHQTAAKHQPAAKPKAAPAAAPAAAPQTPAAASTAPAAAPKPPAPAPAGSSKTEPVVTPSPASSVSGLTPTSTAPSGSTGGSQQVTSGYYSTNWSGYMASNGTFTAVSGSWHATSPSGNGSTTSADSTWIGIGGVTSSDLIQVGTENIVSASGQVSTSAFYELLPAYAVTVPGVSVSAGDSMSASITNLGGSSWKISIIDNSDGQSFSITVSYASSLSSAEWIEEDPSYSAHRQIPFDNFQAAYFAGTSTVENGSAVNLSGSTAQPIIMVGGAGQFIAVPSVISGGSAFSVTP
ncbi:MAG TPA: G1 family glutamic endopeptidase [Candidatus Saccharimonadales bacterium]|nr:G1 family glutamic endopeptidase [Candidatus Saccharimonadales bacterium]